MSDVTVVMKPVVACLESAQADLAQLTPEELAQAQQVVEVFFDSIPKSNNESENELKDLDTATSLALSHELVLFAIRWCKNNGRRVSRRPFDIAAHATLSSDSNDQLLTEAFHQELS